ncbi:hypothetical protein JTE90_003158 [Oedothorax gibbosus]|uniref:Transmembrane protein 199 n=1 Tax=Oedothorax gibbosus TaxID=931172 RepID=A0AAV6UA63_9ARAC|nr:hypothetical protein JTE90_003158 [Oedothorax gibbosus]
MNDIIFSPLEKNSEIFKDLKENVSIDSKTNKKGINVSNLLKLARQGHFEEGSLHEILEKCEMHLCVPPPTPRNPELEERVTRLKNEQDNAAYRSMTNYLIPQERYNLNIGKEVKSVASQMTAVINFVLTVGGSFFFVYKAVEYALPNPNIPAQVMMGIVTSTVVALADLYFLARTI